MGGVDTGRPSRSWPSRDRGAGLAPVLLVIVALVAGCASPAPSPADGTAPPDGASPTAVAPGGSPRSTPPVGQAPTPTPDPAAWTPVDVSPLPEVATLEPTKHGLAGVAVDTDFRLTSLDGRPPATLAAALVAEPAISFEVVSRNGATAVVRPATPLRPATSYRISLTRADGSVEAMWAATAAAPLTVTDTVPGDGSTRVPRDTGIEVTFDQYGVKASDVVRYFTISPKVAGAFHTGGRTVAFAPDRPLAKGTLYTVTVRHGLPLAGTGQVLERDVVFRFETRATSVYRLLASFPHALVDGNRREPTAVAIQFEWPGDNWARRPSSIPVTVHRLPGMRAAQTAYEKIRVAPTWTMSSMIAPVSTKGLDRVYKGNLRVRTGQEDLRWILAPRLPNGWYVLTERWNDVPRQVVLQVTDVATFTLVEQDRSAVWVNDLATKGAAKGATVTIDGKRLGSTDARGLLQAKTPPRVLADGYDARSMLVVRHKGRSAFLPLQANWRCGNACWRAAAPADWWRVFATDRFEYRSTDTVNAWGIVRGRDTGIVPATVTASLLPEAADDGDPAIAEVSTRPDATGAFTVALQLKDLPIGSYRVRLTAGKESLGDTYVAVRTLVKPAYRLELTTDRHAVLVGQPVMATASARFFEGTPVAGTELRFAAEDAEEQAWRTARTDAAGLASATVRVNQIYDDEQWSIKQVSANPTLPEEGEISGTTPIAVFRSTAIVDAGARVAGTRLTVTGTVSDVAFDRFEQPGVGVTDVDPHGDPRANASVRVKVVEERPVRRQVGTRYDFILKRTVPEYNYDTARTTILTTSVATGADGRYRLGADVHGGDRAYDIRVTYVDEAGRSTTAMAWVAGSGGTEGDQWMRLENADDPQAMSASYGVGDTVRVRVRGGGETAGSRYLYAISQRGLHDATVAGEPTFRTTFRADDVPGITISAVRFNGRGYEEIIDGYQATFRATDRAMDIRLSPDKARYAPGESASVSVLTKGADGLPVAATVVVRAVDEKLFAMEAAEQINTLEYLYEGVETGIRGWASSHRTPYDDIPWGKGDTSGGGGDGRSEFRDWLVSTLVRTGADGRATVPVPLSDDLTSWRVIASGVDADLSAGDGTAFLEVGLPFFVEATVAPEYLAADQPVIRLRGFGSGLDPAATVTFTVSSETLPLQAKTVTASAFTAAEVALPKLSVGTHTVRIEASVGEGAARRSDVLTRTFAVVTTRTGQARTTWELLERGMRLADGGSLTNLVLADAGRGRVVPFLRSVAETGSPRADDILAAGVAARVLRAQFGLESTGIPDPAALEGYVREDSGLALLPYASWQLEVTALAAMADDSRLNADALRSILGQVRYDTKERRDRRLVALAGLAALEPSLLPEVQTAATRDDLTVAERISVALAALNAGDEALARELEADILRTSGRRLGGWIRIDAGPDEDPAVQTARLAIVAASLGDPLAADMDRWVEANPSRLTSTNLERALAARGWASRVAGKEAVAALTVDGKRREIRVEPGAPVDVELTPAQAAGASLEPVKGSVLVIQQWEAPFDPTSLTSVAGQTLERAVTPTGSIGPADTVVVTLRVALGSDAGDGCWRLVDLTPSGLTPIQGPRWNGEEDSSSGNADPPGSVDGQRVEFCALRDPKRPVQQFRYVARVVTPGTYTWEPAVLQSTVTPELGTSLEPRTVVISGLED